MMNDKPKLEDLPEMVHQIFKDLEWLKEFLIAKDEQVNREITQNVTLSVTEAAQLTNYSAQTIRTKVMQGEIPSFKLGGKRVFNKAELLDWINRNRRN